MGRKMASHMWEGRTDKLGIDLQAEPAFLMKEK